MATIKITKSMFKAIKLLINSGSPKKEVMEDMGISSATFSHIKNAETYEEYKNIVYMTSGSYRKKMAQQKAEEKAKEETKPVAPSEPQVVEHRQTVIVQATHYMESELKKQTELLALINNKLTLIAEDLGCFKEEKPHESAV